MTNRFKRDIAHMAMVVLLLLVVISIFGSTWWIRLLVGGWFVFYMWHHFINRRIDNSFRWEPTPGEASDQEIEYLQIHDSDWVSIKTERHGREFKIAWRFSFDVPENFSLIGQRKTGGFSTNALDIESNGMLVVESQDYGEVREVLKPGETYFYTFLLRGSSFWGSKSYFVSRFQVAIVADEEPSKESNAAKESDPARENLAQMLKKLGLAIETEDALDEMERNLQQQVRDKKLPKEEEDRKIARIHDLIAQERSVQP